MVRYMAELPPGGKYPTAQERLKLLIGSHIAPVMKEAGYKKLGKRFGKRNADGWLILDIQTSQWSNKDELGFYINTGFRSDIVVRLSEDSPRLDAMPPCSHCHLTERPHTGELVQEQPWTIESEYDASDVGVTVQSLIQKIALPWLDEQSDDSLFKRIARGDGLVDTLVLRAAYVLLKKGPRAFGSFERETLADESSPHIDSWETTLTAIRQRARKLNL